MSNVGYLQHRLGKVAEEAEFMINKLDIAAQVEIAEISIFFLGEEPLLSVFKITELAASALRARKSV